MRNIIFKAKTKSGLWIEGDLIHYESGEMAIVENPFSKYGREATEIARRTKVIPETVCQYTGLTDKNGNRIWENDIALKYSYQGILKGKIVYDNNGSLCHREFETDYETLLIHSQSDVEVIGNIFDNPELMKEEQ